MTTTTHPLDEKHVLEIEGAGSMTETLSGLTAAVLSIVGLAGVDPHLMTPIATIALGIGLSVEGSFRASQYSKLLSMATDGRFEPRELGSGMTTELVAGVVTTLLGVLALFGIAPMPLLPVAVIVAALALTLTSLALSRFNELRVDMLGLSDRARRVTHAAVSTAAGAQGFIGLSTMVLGIVALTLQPGNGWTATLIGLLTLGVSATLSGGALTSRLMRAFKH